MSKSIKHHGLTLHFSRPASALTLKVVSNRMRNGFDAMHELRANHTSVSPAFKCLRLRDSAADANSTISLHFYIFSAKLRHQRTMGVGRQIEEGIRERLKLFAADSGINSKTGVPKVVNKWT